MRLLVVEILAVLCVAAGVALLSAPFALILLGVAGVLACERASSRGGRS